MLMDFGELIEKIVHEADLCSDENFIIYRDIDGNWHHEFIHAHPNDCSRKLSIVKQKDPFVLSYTGRDFAYGSYPSIYDAVLCNRLRAEFCDYTVQMEKASTDYLKLHAFIELIEDNISALSNSATEYIAALPLPLKALHEICLQNLDMCYSEWSSNTEVTSAAIKLIEEAVYKQMYQGTLAQVG